MVQKRKKTQFNLIDALIVMIILALIATAVYLIFGGVQEKEVPGNIDGMFEVRMSGIKENMLPYISEGLSVKDSVTGDSLGKVTAVRSEKSRYYGGVHKNEAGDYVLNMTEYPDEYDVYVTISSSAGSDDRGIYTVGNTRMLIGEAVHFQVKSFSAVSYIVNTDFSEDENPEGNENPEENEDPEGNENSDENEYVLGE